MLRKNGDRSRRLNRRSTCLGTRFGQLRTEFEFQTRIVAGHTRVWRHTPPPRPCDPHVVPEAAEKIGACIRGREGRNERRLCRQARSASSPTPSCIIVLFPLLPSHFFLAFFSSVTFLLFFLFLPHHARLHGPVHRGNRCRASCHLCPRHGIARPSTSSNNTWECISSPSLRTTYLWYPRVARTEALFLAAVCVSIRFHRMNLGQQEYRKPAPTIYDILFEPRQKPEPAEPLESLGILISRHAEARFVFRGLPGESLRALSRLISIYGRVTHAPHEEYGARTPLLRETEINYRIRPFVGPFMARTVCYLIVVHGKIRGVWFTCCGIDGVCVGC